MDKVRILLTAAFSVYTIAASQSGLDRLSRTVAPMERLVWKPFRAEADRTSAMLALLKAQAGPALAAASAAVKSDPYSPDTTPLLGAANLVNGHVQQAEKAFRVAALFGWRNLFTQSYWYQASLVAKDQMVAVERADAILRSNPSIEPGELLANFEEDPQVQKALAHRLRFSLPGCRGTYEHRGPFPPQLWMLESRF